MRASRALLAAFVAAVCIPALAGAAVKPANLFSDHMVLQQDMPVPVWGWADPGEKVTVTLADQSQAAVAGADGKWMVKLAALKTSDTPMEMTIAGTNSITIKDILVGEVWVGSGQSNMQFPVSSAHASYAGLLNEAQEIAAANYPHIRMFTGKNTKSYTPMADNAGDWKICSPETVPDFSAVGYLFARDLQRELKVPVGIVTLAYGASTADAWVSRDAYLADPQIKPILDGFDASETFFKANPTAPLSAAPPRPTPINKKRPAPTARQSDPVQDQHEPTVLFNGMIAPAIPYAMRGVIWYQGESIVGGDAGVTNYAHMQAALIQDWRNRWGEGDFPFFIVQLPALKNLSNNPRIREQQALVPTMVKNTQMAVTIDIGDPNLVHPKNKAPLGERLTLIALANAYGKQVEYSGPVYDSMAVEGGAIRIKFTHLGGGLVAKGGPLKWFQVAGDDQKFGDADAKIDGDSIVVSSPAVKTPVAVRYAWDNYPDGCNLYNAAGLPASPFRTDHWTYELVGLQN
jgi:sialate O-acetylesterase